MNLFENQIKDSMKNFDREVVENFLVEDFPNKKVWDAVWLYVINGNDELFPELKEKEKVNFNREKRKVYFEIKNKNVSVV